MVYEQQENVQDLKDPIFKRKKTYKIDKINGLY